MNLITFADFFCGIGGIRLGFEKASERFKCVYSNDIDEKALITYRHFFNFHNCDNVVQKSIIDIDCKDIPEFDILVGGFPCVSFSIAGNMKGFEDERGQLFFELIRILREKKPKAFLFENVKNLKTHLKGETFKIIKKCIMKEGYFFKAKVMNTTEYGNLPQNRERIYLVGFRDKRTAEKFHFPKEIPLTETVYSCLDTNDEKVPDKYYYTENSAIYEKLKEGVVEHIRTNKVYQYRRTHVRENKSGVCMTLTANAGMGGHNVPIILDDFGIRKITPKEAFNLQGFTNVSFPNISDSCLYKQIGNSVSVPVIKRIAENIEKVLN